MTKLTIEYSDNPAEHDLRALIDGLVAYNSAHAPLEQWQSVVLFLRSGDAKVVGGLNGMTHWDGSSLNIFGCTKATSARDTEANC